MKLLERFTHQRKDKKMVFVHSGTTRHVSMDNNVSACMKIRHIVNFKVSVEEETVHFIMIKRVVHLIF